MSLSTRSQRVEPMFLARIPDLARLLVVVHSHERKAFLDLTVVEAGQNSGR